MIHKTTSRQSGFSLLELLLSTFILAGLVIIVFNIMASYAERVGAQSEAAFFDTIGLAVQEILDNPLYYQAIYDEADAQTADLIELDMNDLISGFTANAVNIPPSNVLNANMQGDISIIIRKSDTGSKEALSILVANKELKNIRIARRIAGFMGQYGGVYENGSTNITSSYQSWQFPITDINTTKLWSDIQSAPPTADTIYYFYYNHVPFEYLTGDYLFRVAVPGRPELNRMSTRLNLGNNNLLGADDIIANGDMNLASGAVINKSLTVQGNTVIDTGDLILDGILSTNNATIKGLGNGNRGNLSVQGAINVGNTATSRNELNAEDVSLLGGMGTSGNLNINQLISNGEIESDSIFSSTLTTSDPAVKQNITAGNQISVNTLTTGQVNIQQGNVGVIDGIVTNNMSVQGNISSNNVEIDRLDTAVFGACDNGC